MPPAPISQTSSPSHSQTQSTFVSSSTPTIYDVFLSFRGTDTRLNFTGHLYDKLDSKGIRTFMDDPELRRGQVISDALLDAIRESNTYIVVLSQNYASSTWCLDELVEIFNCHKAAERSVIPVFYKVHPFVVRHQIGSFKQAFEKHRGRRVKMEKVNKWRLALARVAGLSGFHISENSSEADINNQIVEEILPKINSKDLDVAKYPVGLDSRVKVLTALLNTGTEEGFTRIGLYGMGGVGKTTLAKALFNQLLRTGSFKGSCFLENVREVSRSKGIESLQKIFINAVLNCKPKIKVNNSGEGKMLIKERICSIKVLVLIDDIDDYRQYESLVGSFASGSVVITTTRDQMMLDTIGVEPKFQYRVNELDAAESLTLFTRHAFRNAEQNNTLMVLSADVLRLADGLPLALEVFGSYLYNKSEVGWKSYIKKLQRAPDNSIQQKLIISFNAIKEDDPMLEEIFLDIACFFIGWDKEKVVTILETYYEFADHKIDILQKRCLVKINYIAFLQKHQLDMHDLLRDMGREIVRNISPDEPRRQSRLWVSEDIHDVLKNHEGTEKIECVVFTKKGFPPEEIAYTTKTFERMRKLRFLYLDKVNLTGSFEHTFHDLRWLCWDQCPLECLPSEFYPKNLGILELPDSNMRTMWELNMGSQVFGKLKTLNMSGSKDLSTTPDFTKLPCLETLDLHRCRSLEMVHVSIGSLGKLVSINFEGCERLRTLPDSICSLRALKVLTISECNSLEAMPAQLGNIISLTEFNAGGLTVSKLPDSIGNLTKLVNLDLTNNKNLETLPDTICNLGSLEILRISECERLETLPDQLWKITRLRELDASGATMLKKLPDIGSSQTALSLKKLKLSDSGITALPSGFSQLSHLEELHLSYCEHLLSIPELPPNMKEIRAPLCWSLERIPNLSNLKHLETLDLTKCTALTQIQGLEELTSIRWLDLGGCCGLIEIRGLEQLTSITWLDLRGLSGSLMAYNLTKRLFQLYSEFGHSINVFVPKFMFDWESDCDWITESPYWTSESTTEPTTVYAHLLPNQSHNFMGIILCFGSFLENKVLYTEVGYSVKNTTSGFIWRDRLGILLPSGSVMVIVPKSIFSITDDDHTIEFTADYNVKKLLGGYSTAKWFSDSTGKKFGIHLLYNIRGPK